MTIQIKNEEIMNATITCINWIVVIEIMSVSIINQLNIKNSIVNTIVTAVDLYLIFFIFSRCDENLGYR